MKPKLLIVELWGLGDLVIATPFLQAAARKYEVTLVAKPYASGLRDRFWPDVKVVPFSAPWTAFAFTRKYALHRWPWRGLSQLRRNLVAEKFDIGLSARWDPRDHFLLWLTGAKARLGFPRLRSEWFLTLPLERPASREHRYESWRTLGRALDLALPAREEIPLTVIRPGGAVLIHSGAAQPVRVWPLEKFHALTQRLRAAGETVLVACDPDQRDWWVRAGEKEVATPNRVNDLLSLMDRAGLFVGNDSGPGHLAAFCGLPTLTLFGPQVPEWFAPLHPQSQFLEGKPCPYMPCSDYCQFPSPFCLQKVSEEEVWHRLRGLLAQVRQGAKTL